MSRQRIMRSTPDQPLAAPTVSTKTTPSENNYRIGDRIVDLNGVIWELKNFADNGDAVWVDSLETIGNLPIRRTYPFDPRFTSNVPNSVWYSPFLGASFEVCDTTKTRQIVQNGYRRSFLYPISENNIGEILMPTLKNAMSNFLYNLPQYVNAVNCMKSSVIEISNNGYIPIIGKSSIELVRDTFRVLINHYDNSVACDLELKTFIDNTDCWATFELVPGEFDTSIMIPLEHILMNLEMAMAWKPVIKFCIYHRDIAEFISRIILIFDNIFGALG